MNAEVISRNPGDTAVTLTLDKGTAHGVAKGDLVTTIDGMVGYVSEAGANTCEVTTVTDVDMQCGALITRTRETAIAEAEASSCARRFQPSAKSMHEPHSLFFACWETPLPAKRCGKQNACRGSSPWNKEHWKPRAPLGAIRH